MELGDLKKPLIIIAVLIGLVVYARNAYDPKSVLAYAKKQEGGAGPSIEYFLAMGHMTRSEHATAAAAFEQLLARCATCHSYGPKALLRLGECYEQLKNWQGAKGAYEKYLELYPGGSEKNLVENRYNEVKFKE